MQVVKNSVVTLNYRVTNPAGELVDDGQEPLVYLHGGYDDLFPKLEEALEGKAINDSVSVRLHADEAFGEYDAELVQMEPRENFPETLEVGMQFEGMPESDSPDEEAMIFTVTDIADDKVVLDGNHPLAGIALRFSLTVADVREATDEEIAHGHVHGAHGHDHGDDEEEGDEGDHFRSHPIH